MLFRRFMWVTLSVAVMGVVLSNIIHATYPTDRQFRVENRGHEWKMHNAKQPCRAEVKQCGLILVLSEQA